MRMNRREALRAAAAGAAAALLPAWRPEEKIRLGVASYSLRKFKKSFENMSDRYWG